MILNGKNSGFAFSQLLSDVLQRDRNNFNLLRLIATMIYKKSIILSIQMT